MNTDEIMRLACAVGSHDWFEALSEAVRELEQRAERAEKDAERIDFLGLQNKWNGGTGYMIQRLDSGDVYVRPMRPENAHKVGAVVYPDIRSAIDSAIAQEKK